MYMIEKAKNLAQEKGVYSEPEVYTCHPFDERTEKIVMEYYINDDFNCLSQSPNKSDVITVKINDKKEKKVKRFLTRSLKATELVNRSFIVCDQNMSYLQGDDQGCWCWIWLKL